MPMLPVFPRGNGGVFHLLFAAVTAAPIPLGVVFFIDSQNVYMDARDAFFTDANGNSLAHSRSDGQIDPKKYAELVLPKIQGHLGAPCRLLQVRAYSGRPDSVKEPKTASANAKQVAAWEAAGVVVSQRPLRYPRDWPNTRAQQKGVDVQIATDLVQLYLSNFYDVAMLASTDTDLRPAVEEVQALAKSRGVAHSPIFVTAWNSPALNKRLWLIGRPLYCFFLHRADYEAVADSIGYSV